MCSSYAAASLEQVSTTFDPRFRSASNTDLQQIYLSRQWIQSINSKLIHHFATCALTIDHSVLSEVHDNIVVLQILVCHSMLVCTTHNNKDQFWLIFLKFILHPPSSAFHHCLWMVSSSGSCMLFHYVTIDTIQTILNTVSQLFWESTVTQPWGIIT